MLRAFVRLLSSLGVLLIVFIAVALFNSNRGSDSPEASDKVPEQAQSQPKSIPQTVVSTAGMSSAHATYIDPRQFGADHSAFSGRNIYLLGTAANVVQYDDHTWLAFNARVRSTGGSELIGVVLRPPSPYLLRGDRLCVFGTSAGTIYGRNELTGADEIPLPRFNAYEVTRFVDAGATSC